MYSLRPDSEGGELGGCWGTSALGVSRGSDILGLVVAVGLLVVCGIWVVTVFVFHKLCRLSWVDGWAGLLRRWLLLVLAGMVCVVGAWSSGLVIFLIQKVVSGFMPLIIGGILRVCRGSLCAFWGLVSMILSFESCTTIEGSTLVWESFVVVSSPTSMEGWLTWDGWAVASGQIMDLRLWRGARFFNGSLAAGPKTSVGELALSCFGIAGIGWVSSSSMGVAVFVCVLGVALK